MEVHLPLGILWAQQVIVVLIVYDFKITHISCYFCLSYFWQSSLIEFIGPKKKKCTGAFQLTIRVGHNGFRVVVRKLK